MHRPLILVTEPIAPPARDWLAERAEVLEAPVGSDAFEQEIANAAGLVVRTHTRVDDALLDRAPGVRVVGRAGVGVDNIDLRACRSRGVRVVHTPEANTDAVVAYTWSLILGAVRPGVFVGGGLGDEAWARARDDAITARGVSDLTLGVYGFGRIGSGVGRVGVAMGMNVVYHDLRDFSSAAALGAVPVSRDELLVRADVLTVHVDGRVGNRHLIDAQALSRMKAGVVIVNTSRGFVIDEAALRAHLDADASARALLDVHEREPIGADGALVGAPNVQFSPHVAAATAPAKERMSWVVADVWRVLCGQEPACEAVG